MTEKPCSEIAKEIVNGWHYKHYEDYIPGPKSIEGVMYQGLKYSIAHELQTERTAREEAEKEIFSLRQQIAEINKGGRGKKECGIHMPRESELTALRSKVDELKDKPCPFVVTSDEGTSYCKLSVSSSKRFEAMREIVTYAATVRNDMITEDDGVVLSAQCKEWVDGLLERIEKLTRLEAEAEAKAEGRAS